MSMEMTKGVEKEATAARRPYETPCRPGPWACPWAGSTRVRPGSATGRQTGRSASVKVLCRKLR